MTNVRKAVARRDDAVVAAASSPRPPSMAQLAAQAIEGQAEMLDAVLPLNVDRKRFAAMCVAAVRATPELARCFADKRGAASFLVAASQAAIVGLEPNTPTQDCWILPRRVNHGTRQAPDWAQEAQLSIGYRGILKLARRGSGDIKEVFAEVAHERDEFEWWRGLEADHLHHRPATGDRGAMTHAYAVVRYQHGGTQFIVLDEADVHARRARSDSWKSDERNGTKYSPWNTSERAMWQKSAIRALSPYLDLTAEAAAVVATEDAPARYDDRAGMIVYDDDAAIAAIEPAPVVQAATARDDGPVAPPASQKQLTAVNTLLSKKHGITGEARFDALADLIGREVTSTSDLTAGEAGQVIEQLGALPDMTEQPADGPGTEPFG